MANSTFDVFVTFLEVEKGCLKIWGQVDRNSSEYIESMLKKISAQYDNNYALLAPEQMQVGTLCCAKYTDGVYYRARIVHKQLQLRGTVELKFIDYGNVAYVDVKSLRSLETSLPELALIPPQATEFFLAEVLHPGNGWSQRDLTLLENEICYSEVTCVNLTCLGNYRVIRIFVNNMDWSQNLVNRNLAIPITLEAQYTALHPNHSRQVQVQSISPSAKVSEYQYRCEKLDVGNKYEVYVSYVSDGPCLFSVVLKEMQEQLNKLMFDIAKHKCIQFDDIPLEGSICLGVHPRFGMSRGVITNIIDGRFKVYFVDFGNNDILEFMDIFKIPAKLILPKVMSTRFILAGLEGIGLTEEMKAFFKTYVNEKLLLLEVCPATGRTFQKCHLFDGNINLLNIIKEAGLLAYQPALAPTRGSQSVRVSYVVSCSKFYVQQLNRIDSLQEVMNRLEHYCPGAPTIANIYKGLPCCALYSQDLQWYRAEVVEITKDGVRVNFIDYGNEEIVMPENLRAITSNLVTGLRAQALACCLLGYQNHKNIPESKKLDDVFEALTLELEFMMKVREFRQNEILMVDLMDSAGKPVAAMLLEKMVESSSQQSQAMFSPTTPKKSTIMNSPKGFTSPAYEHHGQKSTSHAREGPQTPSDNFNKPSNDSWRNSQSNTRSDQKNNANYFQRRSPGKQNVLDTSMNSSSYSERFNSSDKRDSRERDSRKKPRNDRSENNSRPYGTNDKESKDFQRKEYSGNRGGGFKGSSSRGDRDSKGYNTDSSSNSQKDFSLGRKFDNASKPSRNNSRSFRSSSENSEGSGIRSKQPEPEYASFSDNYTQQQLTATTEIVHISWFYDPSNWFCQLERNQTEFRSLMNDIQEAYVKRPTIQSAPPGASIIALFNEDKVLYRATVLEKVGPQHKVLFIDFGNAAIANKIWKIEKRFIALPSQAINCTIGGLLPIDGHWGQTSTFDQIFNKERFDCYFENLNDDGKKYSVSLSHNGENIANVIIQSHLATSAAATVQKDIQIVAIDEPIASYMLTGQTLFARLSYVESIEKLHIQLEHWKVDHIASTIKNWYDDSKLCKLNNLQVDSVCVTKYDSNSWARAIIKEINEAELNVFYPDVGAHGTVSVENVYNLPGELSDWYQSFECCIGNVSDQNMQKDLWINTLKRHENKFVYVHIDNVIDMRLMITIYDTEKMPIINSTDKSVAVDVVCPFPVLRDHIKVFIPFVTTSEYKNYPSVFVQSAQSVLRLETLLNEMCTFYTENNTDQGLLNTEIGKYCAALSSDSNWYRSKIIDVNDVGVNVQFVDYGNKEIIHVKNLRELNERFYKPHAFALELQLDILPAENLNTELTDVLCDRAFDAEIFDKHDKWFVSLTEEDVSPLKELIEQGLVLPAPSIDEDVGNWNENVIPVFVSHTDSPEQFYLQLLESSDALNKLQSHLQKDIPKLPNIDTPTDGVLCAAPYSGDDHDTWYRAQVLDADKEITTVRFIDYGNTDVIKNANTSVKTLLNTEYLTVAPYARRCSLEVQHIGNEWSAAACERFEKLLSAAKNVTAKFLHQNERTAFVQVTVDGVDVAADLINEGLAKRDTKHREIITGYISHINSASEFWVQLESAVADLEHISDQLLNATNFPTVVDVSPGSLCTALYPDDESWYRARILSNTVAGIEVLFIDFGNSCTSSELRALPEDLVHLPVLAHKCSLKKPLSLQSWSIKANDKFRAIANDGATAFTVNNLVAGETSMVELILNGTDVSVQLMNESADDTKPSISTTEDWSSSAALVETEDDFDNLQLNKTTSTKDDTSELETKDSDIILSSEDNSAENSGKTFPTVAEKDTFNEYVKHVIENDSEKELDSVVLYSDIIASEFDAESETLHDSIKRVIENDLEKELDSVVLDSDIITSEVDTDRKTLQDSIKNTIENDLEKDLDSVVLGSHIIASEVDTDTDRETLQDSMKNAIENDSEKELDSIVLDSDIIASKVDTDREILNDSIKRVIENSLEKGIDTAVVDSDTITAEVNTPRGTLHEPIKRIIKNDTEKELNSVVIDAGIITSDVDTDTETLHDSIKHAIENDLEKELDSVVLDSDITASEVDTDRETLHDSIKRVIENALEKEMDTAGVDSETITAEVNTPIETLHESIKHDIETNLDSELKKMPDNIDSKLMSKSTVEEESTVNEHLPNIDQSSLNSEANISVIRNSTVSEQLKCDKNTKEVLNRNILLDTTGEDVTGNKTCGPDNENEKLNDVVLHPEEELNKIETEISSSANNSSVNESTFSETSIENSDKTDTEEKIFNSTSYENKSDTELPIDLSIKPKSTVNNDDETNVVVSKSEETIITNDCEIEKNENTETITSSNIPNESLNSQ